MIMRSVCNLLALTLAALLVPAVAVLAGQESQTGDADNLLEQAADQFGQGKTRAALALVAKAIKARPDDAEAYLLRARIHSAGRKYEQAIADLDRVVKLSPDRAETYYERGRENFKAGRFKASVADFDRYVKPRPQLESRQWERGIAYYYTGQYKEGAAQFALYQTYHDNDVENSVWRFMCMARTDGVQKARAAMLPIKNDRRVPMMVIYDMFRGKVDPSDVMQAARAGEPAEKELHARLFYAHLYIALFQEARGNNPSARRHMTTAADKYMIDHYMGDVARVHAAILKNTVAGDSRRRP